MRKQKYTEQNRFLRRILLTSDFLRLILLYKVEAEEILGIVVTDVAYQLCQCFHIKGIQPFFHPCTDDIAQNPAEVFVTGIGSEGAGVGQHTQELAEYGQVGQLLHLRPHTVDGIVEPPCGSLHHLGIPVAGGLEAAQHGTDGGVLGGVDGVQVSATLCTGCFFFEKTFLTRAFLLSAFAQRTGESIMF